MLKFITTITNGNDKLYNKTIVDYLDTGYGVDMHHWISTIASVNIGKLWWISLHIREYKPPLFLNEMQSLQTLPQFPILFHCTVLCTLHLRKPRNRYMKYHSIIAYQEIASMISPHKLFSSSFSSCFIRTKSSLGIDACIQNASS